MIDAFVKNGWKVRSSCPTAPPTRDARRSPLTARPLSQVKGTVRDVEKSQFLTARYTSEQLELVQVKDIVTGEGLKEALEGVDAVAHTASPSVEQPSHFSAESHAATTLDEHSSRDGEKQVVWY